MLEIKHLKAGYNGAPIVHDATLSVKQGSIVALLGANGSGKTTLLRAVTGSIPTMAGEITYKGKSIIGKQPHELVKMGLAMVPEGKHLFGKLSVKDNLRMGAYLTRDKKEIERRLERVHALLPKVKEREKQQADTLSGGEQQMVAIARGLMSDPELLILDEPSLGLMPILVEEVFQFIKEICCNGTTIILVEQNVNTSLEVCDYAYVMQNGETTIEGSGKELLENNEIKKAYLGL
ncbi:MAG: ABC transporter ATP-binding protein [Anaerolineaceae bacterium]|jgi:branched-chain amino acid transport system ATP-binding protein|nr:ABC transporter ATP-binding protein [Anaerolineaceae bacterium]